MNRNKVIRIICFTITCAAVTASAEPQKLPPDPVAPAATAASVPQDYSDTTKEFLKTATENNTFISKAGRLAIKKSENAEIRKFAQQIVRDHVQGYGGFGTDRSNAKISEKALRPEQMTMLEQLEKAGSNFDLLFIDQLVVTLRDALTTSQKYANGGTEPSLKEAAADAVTADTSNLNMAEGLQAKLHSNRK